MPSKDPVPTSTPMTGSLLRASEWTITRRVIGALLLRELLTRYGRNNIGFLWLFIEPMLFIALISLIWATFRNIHGSVIPIAAFALTGYSSMLLWRNMPSRCIGALKANVSLLFHRQVTIQDVYIARVLLEVIALTTSFAALGIIFSLMDWIPAPEDMLQVLLGWLLLAWFGVALGWTIGGLAEKWPPVGNVWGPFSYILIIFSGVMFLAEFLPPHIREIALWLPMLNSLEYMREGWFGSLFEAYYDIPYVIAFNLVMTLIGLSLIRQVGTGLDEE